MIGLRHVEVERLPVLEMVHVILLLMELILVEHLLIEEVRRILVRRETRGMR